MRLRWLYRQAAGGTPMLPEAAHEMSCKLIGLTGRRGIIFFFTSGFLSRLFTIGDNSPKRNSGRLPTKWSVGQWLMCAIWWTIRERLTTNTISLLRASSSTGRNG